MSDASMLNVAVRYENRKPQWVTCAANRTSFSTVIDAAVKHFVGDRSPADYQLFADGVEVNYLSAVTHAYAAATKEQPLVLKRFKTHSDTTKQSQSFAQSLSEGSSMSEAATTVAVVNNELATEFAQALALVAEHINQFQSALHTLKYMQTPRKHRSSLVVDLPPEEVYWDVAGYHFSFENREAQANELLDAFIAMEQIRKTDVEIGGGETVEKRWEVLKRTLLVPVCTGIPGLGKTRFARDGIYHIVDVARKTAGLAEAELLTAANMLPCPTLTRALVHAVTNHCNLRLDCSLHSLDTEQDVAVALLLEWRKGYLEDPYLIAKHLHNRRLTVLEALEIILEHSSTDEGGDGIPAVIINVDEAHKLSVNALWTVLRCLLKPLIVNQLRVFVAVTGIAVENIRKALDLLGVLPREIILPLLQVQHMKHIVAKFFPEHALNDTIMNHVLWWLGGVPRFLQFLLQESAEFVGQYGDSKAKGLREPVGRLLAALTPETAATLIDALSSRRYMQHISSDGSTLKRILALALLAMPVSRSQPLPGDDGSSSTLGAALRTCLVYWKGLQPGPGYTNEHGDALGTLEIPPVVLHSLHTGGTLPTISVLRYLKPFPTTRDNEVMVVAVLMQKLYALSLLKKTKARLFELGILTHASLMPDVEVDVPDEFTMEKVPHTITKDNFEELVNQIRRTHARAFAFVNTPTASFANAFIILSSLIIFVQEKQKSALIEESEIASPMKDDELCIADEKLGSYALSQPHVFLYITDEDKASESLRMNNACVVSRSRHEALLGPMLAYLRSAAVDLSVVKANPPTY